MSAPTATRDGALARVAQCAADGARAGLRTAAWLLLLMVPISLGVMLLRWSGALAVFARATGPVFLYLGLPREAALPFVAGALVNCYTGIAAMGSIVLTAREATILALMILVSHNLPVEVSIQHKAGSPAGFILPLRLGVSFLAGLLLNAVMPAGDAAAVTGSAVTADAPLREQFAGWGAATGWLSLKIVALVVGLMVLQRLIRAFGVDEMLAAALAPFLRILGLPRRTAFLWIVANVLGLGYGAGVLLEETRNGGLSPEDARVLNPSIAVCHSLLEDTLLFVAVGASAFWITVPRLALAAAAVWSYRAWRAARGAR